MFHEEFVFNAIITIIVFLIVLAVTCSFAIWLMYGGNTKNKKWPKQQQQAILTGIVIATFIGIITTLTSLILFVADEIRSEEQEAALLEKISDILMSDTKTSSEIPDLLLNNTLYYNSTILYETP